MRLDLLDAMALIGTLLIGAGAWMVYQPAGLLSVGVILLALGIFGARGGR